MKTKIAVVGDKGSVLGFKALGFEVFHTEKDESAIELIKKLAKEEYGILFVMEELIENSSEIISEFKDSMIPAVVPIPSRNGSLGIGMANIYKNVERAVGADIFGNEKGE